MARFSLDPGPELAPWVDRIWGWEGEPGLAPMLPGTGAELVFHETPPALVGPGTRTAVPRFHLACPRSVRRDWESDGPATFWAVRFRSSAVRHFLPQPLDELADRFPSAGDLWGPFGREWESRLAETPAGGRAGVLRAGLVSLAARWGQPDPWVDAFVDDLYYAPAGFSFETGYGLAPVGRRQAERRVLAAVGTSPKTFQRTARFQRLLKTLLLSGRDRYLEAALDAGYYDQSHFVREFRRMTGETPRDFLTEARFASHFYNTSRPRRG